MAQRFAGGAFTSEDFKSTFGLASVPENKAYSKGSSTGTKQVGGLGTYLSKDDFERLRNDDQVWKAYGAIYGEDKMKEKREGNEDGLSINALDALMDELAAPASESESESEAYKPSDPTPELLDARKEWDRYQPGGDMNPDGTAGSIHFNPGGSDSDGGGSGIKAAADYGNRATDDYSRRFLPQMKAQADLEAMEIGRSGSDAVRRFEGKPPKLGDPKDLFNFYSKKINSAVD